MGRIVILTLLAVAGLLAFLFPPRPQPLPPPTGTSRTELGSRHFYQHGQGRPLVVLHGGGSSALAMEKLSGLSQLKMRVIYPQGVGGNWNDGRQDSNSAASRQNVDDLAFLSSLHQRFGRFHLLGFSNGALMAGHFACRYPEQLSGLICVRGTLTGQDSPRLAPELPVLLLQAPQDPLLPFGGGSLYNGRGTVRGAEESLALWRGAGAQVSLEELPGREHDWTPSITARIRLSLR